MSLLPGKFYLDDFFDDIVPTVKHNDMKCDIYEKGGEIHVEMDTPGYKKEDIKIDYSDEYLTIEASKENETSNEEKNYIRKERTYGSVKRQFYVGKIDENNIKAEFKNGVLKISFPKLEQKESKKYIEIK